MRRALQIVLTLVLLAIPARAALAQPVAQDPAAVVTAFVNASAAQNADAAEALVADNAVFSFEVSRSLGAPTADVYTGKAQIRTQFIETAPTGLRLESVQASGNTVTANLSSDSNDQLRSMGLERMGYVLVATVENGLITSATLDFTPETKAAVQIISSGPAGPVAPVGMPTTGSGDQAPLLAALALVAVLLAGTGLFLARRRA
jgi:LPXTG-motif cell wall-anchored protein